MKRGFLVIAFIFATLHFSAAYAHGTFTWFGFRNDNAEIMINSGTPHHSPACNRHDCGHKKPPKPKHKHHKKPPKHHEHKRCFWWRCD